MSGLGGKRVLIVGASSGIGTATAERFAQRGAALALVARGAGLAPTAARVRDHGAVAHELHADVADRDAFARTVVEAEEALGGIDVAVLNVGISAWGAFEEISAKEFDRVVDVTFGATVDAIRLLLPILERSSGVLVLTGSVAGRVPLSMMSAYVSAKHALHGFAGSLRMELRARHSGVRIAVVAPGPVDSPFWKHAGAPAGRSPVAPALLAPYSSATVAAAIVEAAERPRRETTVGGAMVAVRAVYGLAGGMLETAMAIGIRYFGGADDSEADMATLERPTSDGEIGSGLHGRPSALGLLRRAPGGLARAARAR
ncbi:MAG TPA: SDR family NAD(P)-dependent oxidoreductase [Thermoleophilaceae bacterium]|nr:SDR family NAD(P)-dependent oxidoreductase [Thermoleophilaceae bacterium]